MPSLAVCRCLLRKNELASIYLKEQTEYVQKYYISTLDYNSIHNDNRTHYYNQTQRIILALVDFIVTF